MPTDMHGLVAGLFGLLGLLIGSFLNVVVHRLPKMLEAELGARSGPGVERLLAFGSPSGSPAATAGTWASGADLCGQVRPRLTRLLRMQARVVPRN